MPESGRRPASAELTTLCRVSVECEKVAVGGALVVHADHARAMCNELVNVTARLADSARSSARSNKNSMVL